MNTCQFRILALAMALLALPANAAEPVKIAVTSSFQPTLEVLARRLELASGQTIELSSSSTGTLYQQAAQGAPYDLFLAADGRHPLRLVRDRLAAADELHPYARGQLILAGGPPTEPPRLSGVLTPRLRIAIPNPISAPYGQAAQEWLSRMRYWDEVRPRLVTANNVAHAIQLVESASVDLAFSALPLAQHLRRNSYSVVPARDYPPIVHVGVVLTGGANQAGAVAVFRALRSEAIQAELLALGYLPLPEPAGAE